MDRREFCKGLFATAVSLAIPTTLVDTSSGSESFTLDNLPTVKWRELGNAIEFTITKLDNGELSISKSENGKTIILGKGKLYIAQEEE